ncbi:MAG: PrsW family glutamic-type intramembrane protease [Candidatus Absconditabacterales bacterium]
MSLLYISLYTMIFVIISSIVALNILSGYFWIWLFKELFKRNISIKDIIVYGFVAAAGSLGIAKGLQLSSIATKVLTEEGSKSVSSYIARHSSQEPRLASDYVAHAIVCGVGFAIIENIIYIYYSRNGGDIASIGVTRILSNSIMHAIFTGIIGYGAYEYAQKPKLHRLYWVILGFFGGVGLHRVYNRSLISSHLAISIIFIIGGYYMLAFLLYKSDRLFIDNQTPQHVDGEV